MEDFKLQIEEDIEIIQRNFGNVDARLEKPEFAFNYWVLSRIFSLDEEVISPNITEYNDKNIDCFVHYEDAKELYIIQNKYYSEATPVSRDNVSDFLKTPISALGRGDYSRSPELQRIFDRAKDDSDYKIWLHFFVTNNNHSDDIDALFDEFSYNNPEISAYIGAKYFDLNELRKLYFGERFTEKTKFTAIMPTRHRATSLDVRPDEYGLPWMIDLRYVMINVAELYSIYREAEKRNYELFEENIREYLGTQGINNGIIKTLKSPTDRENFFYYNNGVTIICEKCETLNPDAIPLAYKKYNYNYGFRLTNPQIVNGCQTINSIAEVLSHFDDDKMHKEFEKSYVLAKVFVFDENTKSDKAGLDKNIVRYTNSQNGISDKAFASKKSYFLNIQDEFLKRGYLLLVKPSDKNKFSLQYSDTAALGKLQDKSKYINAQLDINPVQLSDYMIPLEKLLKVLLAFREDGFIAFTRGSSVLKPNSPMYKEFSLNIETWCTIDNMLNLYLLHYKAEIEKKNSDKRFPIPYYVLGFIGATYHNATYDELKPRLDELFGKKDVFLAVYNFYKMLTRPYATDYTKTKSTDYNVMIKQEIDLAMFDKCFEMALDMYPNAQVIKDFIKS
ncbi:MAG: AIPR family protein [Christensenellaceae bacterium]|jgi:hypothetical protein|nr:AIPR family protein [Christensenellaceae bacterium]